MLTNRELLNWGAWWTILVHAIFGFSVYVFHHELFVWEPYIINYIFFGMLWWITEEDE